MGRRLNEDQYTKIFEKSLNRRGWKFSPSSVEEDMFDHIDGRIHIYDKGTPVRTLTVDLKGHKFRSKHSKTLCQYIEFMNVRGQKGWLYGKADVIAILSEDEKTFYLIFRKDLIRFCQDLFGVNGLENFDGVEDRLLKLKCWVNRPDAATHKLYRRKRLKDIVTQITMKDVKELAKIKI